MIEALILFGAFFAGTIFGAAAIAIVAVGTKELPPSARAPQEDDPDGR